MKFQSQPSTDGVFDFFVSYAKGDNYNGLVTKFIEALAAQQAKVRRSRQYSYFLDDRAERTEEDWARRILPTAARAKIFLAFISPRYLTDPCARREWDGWVDIERSRGRLGKTLFPIHFVEVAGLEGEQSLDDVGVAARAAVMAGRVELDHATLRSAEALVRQIRRRPLIEDFVGPIKVWGEHTFQHNPGKFPMAYLARLLASHIERIEATPTLGDTTVPPCPGDFSGRLEDLFELRDLMVEQGVTVVRNTCGLRGVGSTTLARAYAHGFATLYPGGRFELDAQHAATFREALLKLADFPDCAVSLSDDDRQSADSLSTAVLRFLAKRTEALGPLLLVLDDVQSSDLANEGLRAEVAVLGPKVHILATTMGKPSADDATPWLQVDDLSEQGAVDFLTRFRTPVSSTETEITTAIVRRLGGFALAIRLFGSSVQQTPAPSLERLAGILGLEVYEDRPRDRGFDLRHFLNGKRLAAVLEPTLQALSDLERRLLEYASILPSRHIPLAWLKELVDEDCARYPTSPSPANFSFDACQRFLQLAIFATTEEELHLTTIVQMHILVQWQVHNRMTDGERRERHARVDELVLRRAKGVAERLAQSPSARWEMEPLEAVAQSWADAGPPKAEELLRDVARGWRTLGQRHRELALRSR